MIQSVRFGGSALSNEFWDSDLSRNLAVTATKLFPEFYVVKWFEAQRLHIISQLGVWEDMSKWANTDRSPAERLSNTRRNLNEPN